MDFLDGQTGPLGIPNWGAFSSNRKPTALRDFLLGTSQMSPLQVSSQAVFGEKSGSTDPQSWRFRAPFKSVIISSQESRKQTIRMATEHGAAMATLDKDCQEGRSPCHWIPLREHGHRSTSTWVPLPPLGCCAPDPGSRRDWGPVPPCRGRSWRWQGLLPISIWCSFGRAPWRFRPLSRVSSPAMTFINCLAHQETAPGSCPPRQWDCQVAPHLEEPSKQRLSQEVTGYMATDKATRMAISKRL